MADFSDLPPGLLRREFVGRGLAGFAAALVSPGLIGCGDDDSSAPADGGPALDAGPTDAGVMIDGGPVVFPTRDLPDLPALRSLIPDIGPLGDPDENGVRLAAGFTSRVVARSGQLVPGTDYEWHPMPDGGATFITEDEGWIYVSNSEMPIVGGVGALRFDASGEVIDAYPLLERTQINCAGGLTPWHTWLSCEEIGNGRVYECDPWGETPSVVRPALGVFRHEAAAVDPVNWHLYLTEDEGDGRFYRFRPDGMNRNGFPELGSGTLEVAQVDGSGAVSWLPVPDPLYEGETPTRLQVPESTAFDGGEGIWYHEGVVYFATKGSTRIWAYEIEAAQISVLYDGEAISDPPLRGVDNVTVSCCGDVLVAEDGGSMQVVAILPSGEAKPIMQIVGQDSSEVTGPAFDPSGTRLYFSSQRGDGQGITYEIEGPFHEPA